MSELHRFSRTELLIGPEGLEKLKNRTVAVFGLGGSAATRLRPCAVRESAESS
jgi:tRNA A37 threonylcarbamoyladenosine dehydratase